MARIQLNEAAEPTSEEPSLASQTVGAFMMSVAFWLSLLTSVLMYAAVSLSPKLADWINVRQQHASNAARLAQLEDEADYLERVAAALKSDPEFVQQLVGAEKSSPAEDARLVTVTQDLLFEESARSIQEPTHIIPPALANLVFHLSSDQQHRTWLLVSAAGLTLLAFTLLNDAGSGIAVWAMNALFVTVRAAVGRYRAAAPRVQELEEDSD